MSPVRKGLRWAGWIGLSLPFFAVMGVFRLMGVDAASATGGWLARRFGPMAPAHRTAVANLAAALPEQTADERATILDRMWNNLGRTFAEYAHFRAFAGFPNARVQMSGREHVEAALAQGKGAILVSGHFANWEVMALAAYQAGFDGCEIYRPANNPIVNWWIVRQRRRWAYPLQVPKTADGTRDLLRTLKAGKSIAMLADQKYREGRIIPFFGRDAMTAMGPAVLTMRTGAALIPVTMRRLEGARFAMAFHPPIEVARTGDKDADGAAVLLAVNRFLEEAVRAEPSQWLWPHNRWQIPRSVRLAQTVTETQA